MTSNQDLKNGAISLDISKEEFVEQLYYRSKYAGVGTVGRDIEVELRSMRNMASFAVQTCDLSESEIDSLAEYYNDWRRMRLDFKEELDEDQIVDVIDSEMKSD